MPFACTIDGEPRSESDATIPVLDRGFLLGDAVFETLRSYHRQPFALEQHLSRLKRSSEAIGIRWSWPDATLVEEVGETLTRSGESSAYLRIMITRGSGPLGLDVSAVRSPLRVVIAAPLATAPLEALRERGVTMVSRQVDLPFARSAAAGAKVTSYLLNVLLHAEARAKGADDALLVSSSGDVLEGSSSNVFLVRGSRLITPSLDRGILPGITRATVLQIAPALGLVPSETRVTLEELLAADEVFSTSSVREIVPIVSLDAHPVGTGEVGPSTRALQTAYRLHVDRATGRVGTPSES